MLGPLDKTMCLPRFRSTFHWLLCLCQIEWLSNDLPRKVSEGTLCSAGTSLRRPILEETMFTLIEAHEVMCGFLINTSEPEPRIAKGVTLENAVHRTDHGLS